MYQITPSRSYRRMTLLYFSTQKRYYPLHGFVVFNYAPRRWLVIFLIRLHGNGNLIRVAVSYFHLQNIFKDERETIWTPIDLLQKSLKIGSAVRG